MRVGPRPPLGVGDAHRAQQADGLFPRLAMAAAEIDLEGLGDLLPGAHERVQRRHRLLEDHRDQTAAAAAQRLGVGQQVGVLEQYSAARPRVGRQQAEDRAQHRRLAAPGLADQAECHTRRDLERDVVDDPRDAAARADLDDHVAHVEQRGQASLGRSSGGLTRDIAIGSSLIRASAGRTGRRPGA